MTPIMKAGGRRSPSPPLARHSQRRDDTAPQTASDPLKRCRGQSPTEPLNDRSPPRPSRRTRADDQKTMPALDPHNPRDKRNALRRNRHRLDDRNLADESTISKYLPVSIARVLGSPIHGPDDNFDPPGWLMTAVEAVAIASCRTPSPPPVCFGTLPSDLATNAELLRSHNNDLGQLLRAARNTTMDPSAEFRPIHQLQQIFSHHPHFLFVRDIIENGMNYVVEHELTEQQRTLELEANLKRGNHKSASENVDHLVRLLARDVKFGFAMPLPITSIHSLKGAMVQPAGLANQFSLQPDGSRVRKQRLTHDLSYSATIPRASVNSRIDMSAYPEMVYGWCLLRVVHFVVALRLQHPGTSILIAKYDFSDAYRRIAHSASAAAKTTLALGGVAYVMLRLAFGGSPNPPVWCAFSEMVTDLANELPLCKSWDPTTRFSPAQPTNPKPKTTDTNIPFGRAEPMAVHIPTTITAKADCFIDDIVQVLLATPDNIRRQPPAVPLAVHLSNRPHQGDQEPMPRRANISEPKLLAEGTPSEVQIVLGWEMATRELTIRLPQDKFIAWTVDVAEILRTTCVTFHELESCLGRLNHAAFLIPLSRHFITWLQRRLIPRRPKQQQLTLSADELEDLKLWLKFLRWARQGISMNLITHRYPSTIAISDSCPFGLGGFLWSGRAWRLRIPPGSIIYGNHTANNALELLAMVLNIWLAVLENPTPHRCILGLGDNTSAIGWLFHSSFINRESLYDRVVPMMARKLATVLLEARQTIFGQHLPGVINVVADLLSFTHQTREGKANPLAADQPTNSTLTQRFHQHMPQLIPPGFVISPLPSELLSFATLALQTMESSMRQRAKRPSSQKTGPGEDGSASAKLQASISPSSITYPTGAANSSSDHSSPASGQPLGPSQETFLESVRAPFQQRLSEMPQATWLRRFRESPVHLPHSSQLLPSLRALFKAYDNLDPPQQRQKAVTPKFLRALHKIGASPTLRANAYDHAVDLIIGAFFFAMRSCEYCVPTKPGHTKTIRLRHLCFRDQNRQPLPFDHAQLDQVAAYVTVTFENQKSGVKMDSRSQKRTEDPLLCPCKRLGRAVMRVVHTVPGWSPDTLLCTLQGPTTTKHITNNFTKRLLRHACKIYGGHKTFGFHPHEIGNHSIRSGAAMALFLKDHSTAKIMILGRWSSDAFLVYIRPQVLEWANNMSSDMVSFDSFLDVGLFDRVSPDDPRTRQHTQTLNGSSVTIPSKAFNLHH